MTHQPPKGLKGAGFMDSGALGLYSRNPQG